MEVRKVPGTVIVNQATRKIIYTRPVGEALLQKLLSNWKNFSHQQDDLEPLAKTAVSHCQFEAIHPFIDEKAAQAKFLMCYF